MSVTPYCPKCGSVKVVMGAIMGICQEDDCGYVKNRRAFTDHVGHSGPGNTHWRDPVALTPGGYDDN